MESQDRLGLSGSQKVKFKIRQVKERKRCSVAKALSRPEAGAPTETKSMGDPLWLELNIS